jgi:hypothetical protein
MDSSRLGRALAVPASHAPCRRAVDARSMSSRVGPCVREHRRHVRTAAGARESGVDPRPDVQRASSRRARALQREPSMRRCSWSAWTAIIAGLACMAGPAAAGPTIIRDELLQDTSVTPSLGRGYSIATNTYQSTCLIDVVGTEPSYNFDYTFREITEDEVRTGNIARGSESSGRASVYDYSGKQPYQIANEWRVKQTETDKGGERHYHHMLVTIDIDVYYNSVDEAKSKLSPAAVKILESKDVPGFFDACGMYYVRSISRRAVVYSLFTYSSTSSTRDVAFDSKIKASIRRFDLKGDRRYDDSQSSTEESTTGNQTTKSTATDLQISTKAVGLGKSQATDLIAYDLDTFKASIKSAFKATQPQNVGMVTAIEVVPWIENTEFQAYNKLEPKTVPVTDEQGVPVFDLTDPKNPKPQTKVVLPYEQKRIMSVNAEFLAEIDRAARAKLDAYYKAKMCRSQLNLDLMEMDANGKWRFRRLPGATSEAENTGTLSLANNRKPGAENWITVADLDGILSEPSLVRIWMEYDAFMYGGTGKDDKSVDADPEARAQLARAILLGTAPEKGYPKNVFPGAGRCIADLFAAGISAVSYRTLTTCQRIEESFATINAQRIDDYCMPRLAPQP